MVPLAGDLAQPGLGLSPVVFAELARTVDVIHHAGAQVNFIYPYEELRAANVAGTRELIRLAGLARGIPLHYISSTAVLAGLGAAGVRAVTEDTPLDHADQLGMGYIETKYVAEEMLRAAARAGLPVTDLPAAGRGRGPPHRGVEHRDRDVRADPVHGRHRPGPGHRPAARFRARGPVRRRRPAHRHSQPATGRTYHLASPQPRR